MTVARSAGDVLSDHTVFEIESHRPHVLQRVGPATGLRRRGAGLLRGPPGPPLRVHGVDGPDDQGVRRRHPRLRRRARAGVGVVRQGTQRRCGPAVPGPVHRPRGGAVRGPRAGEGAGVAHPAPLQRRRGVLRLAGALHGVRQLLLLLLRGRGFRPVLHQVLHLLPLHRQAVHQRQRVGQTPGRQGRDRVRGPRQRVRRGRRRRGAADGSATASDPRRSTRCCASGCGSCPTRSPTTTRPPATATSCRSCRPSSR